MSDTRTLCAAAGLSADSRTWTTLASRRRDGCGSETSCCVRKAPAPRASSGSSYRSSARATEGRFKSRRRKAAAVSRVIVSPVKHVVILGAGFAGLELATRLSESLADEVRATLIDQNDSFSFGFAKLDVLFGGKAKEDVALPYRDISKQGVEFRQERVLSIDPESRRVTTDAASYDADVLVVALGAHYDFAA